jgi:hypothetical protein
VGQRLIGRRGDAVRAVIGLLAVALLVAGCTSSTTGDPRPQPGADTSTAPSVDNSAPHVTHPLDTTKWQPNPCAAMTPSQLAALGVTRTGALTTDPKGNYCDWKPQPGATYTLGFNTRFDPGDAQGLANIYEFATAPMRRLPDIDGVVAVTSPSGNTNGGCTIYLGATDSVSYGTAVVIDPGLPHYADPCTPAHQLAQDVTETMKAG